MKINPLGLSHLPKSYQAYALDKDHLAISIKTARGDIQHLALIWGDPFDWGHDPVSGEWVWRSNLSQEPELSKIYSDAYYDYWRVTIAPSDKRVRYAFLIENTYIYGAHGIFDLEVQPHKKYVIGDYFNFPYLNEEDIYSAPDWVSKAIWYQIFPERFANGDASLNPSGVLPWDNRKEVTNAMIFGGDLVGVQEHLDYLEDLGVNAIYFTPIFEATSTHKYDTIDYYHIDPVFGDNRQFRNLVEGAHQRGIKVMLDGVFNHCGFMHPFFQDVVKRGKASRYYDWFHITGDPLINFPLKNGYPAPRAREGVGRLNYETFAYTPMMPKWRTGHPACEAYLLDIGRYWIEQFDIDGWRLDVSNEVSHDFWRKFRTMAKGIKPDLFLLGENWDDATPWLMGDQFDAVMHYEWTTPVWRLLGDATHVPDHYNVESFINAMSKLHASVPAPLLKNMFNLLDSHDTSRVRTLVGGNIDKVKQAFMLLMIFAGSPSVYYGSEQGLEGVADGNRVCMVWDKNLQNQDLYNFVRSLIALRKEYDFMRSERVRFSQWQHEKLLVVYKDHVGMALFNVDSTPLEVLVPKSDRGSYEILAGTDNKNGNNFVAFDTIELLHKIHMPAHSCVLLKRLPE